MNMEICGNHTGLLVVDLQERLVNAMPEDTRGPAIKNCETLVYLSEQLGLPIGVTEQYPQGLGPTIDDLGTLRGRGLPKTEFSAWRNPEIRQMIESANRQQWILTGLETHICVFQTARDLIGHGYTVWIPADAVLSRRRDNWEIGLSLLKECGAHIASTESLLFDLLKDGKGALFREISRRIR